MTDQIRNLPARHNVAHDLQLAAPPSGVTPIDSIARNLSYIAGVRTVLADRMDGRRFDLQAMAMELHYEDAQAERQHATFLETMAFARRLAESGHVEAAIELVRTGRAQSAAHRPSRNHGPHGAQAVIIDVEKA